MYLTHFGLQEKPFKTGTDPRFLWLGTRQREALATLAHCVLQENGFIVVTGDVGTGKTTFANALLSELENRSIVAKVTYPDFEGVDFLKLILKAYGQGGGLRSQETFFDHFTSYLRNSFALGKPVVLIIDDAQKLTSEYLSVLFDLCGVRENGTPLLKMVFVGQKRLEDLLSKELERVPGLRVAFSHKMEKLTQGETAQYIAHRLNIAHCEKELFPPRAIEEIFSFSKGIPILINMVCELCLSRTFIKGEETVRPETVKECVKLLNLPEEQVALEAEAPEPPTPHDVEVTAQNVPAKSMMDAIKETIAGKPVWVRTAAAAAIGFLVISIGFTFFMMPGTPPDSGKTEVKKEAAPATGGETGSVTAPPDQTSRSSDAATQLKVPVTSRTDGSAQSTRTKKRETPGTRASAEKSRQGQAERSRRESGAAADNTRRGTSTDNEGTVSQEPVRQGTEKMESGEVIDMLIKKRSEQK